MEERQFSIPRRSEEDKILRAPLVLKLGGKEYLRPVLCIRDARVWRAKLQGAFKELEIAGLEVTDVGQLIEAIPKILDQVLVKMPEKVVDLVFAYTPGPKADGTPPEVGPLPREEIEATASDEEMAQAFLDILGAALPFRRALQAFRGLGQTLPAAMKIGPGSGPSPSSC